MNVFGSRFREKGRKREREKKEMWRENKQMGKCGEREIQK
jgi:hypothetical protein